MCRTKLPTAPWQDCAAVLLGPLPGGENLFVIVDYYSRWFEVVEMRSTTSAKIISSLRPIFARWGIPESLRTDNGPQFVSDEFQSYLSEIGTEHRLVTPYWPQANGEVERQNRTLLKSLKIAYAEGTSWRDELLRLLVAYRSTPHTTTGRSPFEMMCGRQMRTKLPQLSEESLADAEVRDRDWSAILKGKSYPDATRGASPSSVVPGEKGLVREQHPQHKLSSPYSPTPATALSKSGEKVVVGHDDGSSVHPHSSHLKPFQQPSGSSADYSKSVGPPVEKRGGM